MSAVSYYSKRRLNPYQGLIMVIDGGGVRAYSSHGHHWRLQSSEYREVHWDREQPTVATVSRQAMAAAMRQPPRLPFVRGDHYELWLLERDSARPLALLDSARHASEVNCEDIAPRWHAFVNAGERFRGADGQRYDGHDLIYMVESASRPAPMAQWFLRRDDGGGTGMGGLRIGSELEGRSLGADAFPEMLLREDWGDAGSRELSRAYHDWLAGYLLAHDDLSELTRRRLEQQLLHNPQPFLHGFPQLPTVLDSRACRAAWVAAQLCQTGH